MNELRSQLEAVGLTERQFACTALYYFDGLLIVKAKLRC